MTEYRFNQATIALLAAAASMDEGLLRGVCVRHRRHNWLHAPWYPASEGGGGMTIGHIIHVTPRHDPATLGADRERWFRWIMLMAHEAGHVRQAERFGFHAWGRARFTLWAMKNYVVSFLLHGRKAHAKAAFEQDADRGRQRLRAWMEASGGCNASHALIGMIMRDDEAAVRRWLRAKN